MNPEFVNGVSLMQGDCLERMKEIPDGSVDLVVMDPPYGIGKDASWDKFTESDYLEFMKRVFMECIRVLADNGQIYFFHNDIEKVTTLMQMLKSLPLVFSSFLIFPKPLFRPFIWTNPTEKNNLRCWFNICEYALLYINSKSVHTEWDKTGWDRVRLDVNNFTNLRKYAFDMLCYIGGGTAYQVKQIERDLGHRKAEHFFYCQPGKKEGLYGSTQWSLTTPEVYQQLIDKYDLRKWSGFREYEDLRREYEDLRREYEDLRPVHNLDPVHCNVWNVKWTNSGALHPCQKPTEVLERMIKCSSRPGAVVLDCFMGSGSTGVAAVNTSRKFIGIELDEDFYETAKHRIAEAIKEKNKENNEAAPEAVF